MGTVAPAGVRVELAEQRIASAPSHRLLLGHKVPATTRNM
jgi:hypothetical protein